MLELDPAIEHHFLPPDRVVFARPNGSFTIIDKAGLIGAVLDCLQAGLPIEQAFEKIEDPDDRAEISEHVLGVLLVRGVLRERRPDEDAFADKDLLCAWLRFVGAAKEHKPHIGVIGAGQMAAALQSELAILGLTHSAITEIDETCDLIVLCQDYEEMTELRAINKQAVDAKLPFLPVRMQRHVVCLGPMIIPGATACVECVYHREQMNVSKDEPALNVSVPTKSSDFVARFAAMLAGAEIARFLFGAIYDLHIATLTRYSVLTGKQAKSVALKVPRCPTCGLGRADRPLADTFVLYEDNMLEPAE